MDEKDLKIQFRAVRYGLTDTRVLQYRIDPEQDLSYTTQVKYLFGLIKFNVKKKYSTEWHTPEYFIGTEVDESKSHYLNWRPFWIKSQEDLDSFKKKYKTFGEFEKHISQLSAEGEKKWNSGRKEFLEKVKTIY